MIGKVWKQKMNNVKLLTIPKSSKIEDGDYVYFEKVDDNGKKKKN